MDSGWIIAGATSLALVFTVIAGIWKVFQGQVETITRQNEYLQQQITEATRLATERIHRDEHNEMAKRIDGRLDAADKRLDVIETTRPTTGELGAMLARRR